MKNFIKQKLATASLLATSIVYGTASIYCDDVFSAAKNASTNLASKLKDLAAAILPLMIIVAGVSLLFTRDEKKIASEKKFLIACCAGYAIILLADKVIPAIQQLITGG